MREILTRAMLAAAATMALAAAAQQSTTLTGDQLSVAQLSALAQEDISVTFDTAHGTEQHRWRGPALWSVLRRDDPALPTSARALAAQTLRITGADGYAASLAAGEIAPSLEGKHVLLAIAQDGKPLPRPRLIVPSDRDGARDVSDVVRIEID